MQPKGVAFNASAGKSEPDAQHRAGSTLPLIRAGADAVGDALRSTLGVGAEDERAAHNCGGDVVEFDEAGRAT